MLSLGCFIMGSPHLKIGLPDTVLRQISESQSLYEGILPVLLEDHLNLMVKSPDSYLESESLEDGRVQVTIHLPIDDNNNPADGRCFLQDTFILDAEEKNVLSFDRKCQIAPGFTLDGAWMARAEKIEVAHLEWLKEKESTEAVQSFYRKVLLTRPRPLTQGIKDELKKQQDYLGKLISEGGFSNGPRLRVGDAQAHIAWRNFRNLTSLLETVDYPNLALLKQELPGALQNDTRELQIAFPLDEDKIPENGRLWVRERFRVDSQNHLVGSQRDWRVAPEFSGPGAAEAKQRVKAIPDSHASPDQTKNFLEPILAQVEAELPEGAKREASDLKLNSPSNRVFSGWANYRKAASQVDFTATGEGLALFRVAALEFLQQRHHQDGGLYDQLERRVRGKTQATLADEQRTLEGLYQKASELPAAAQHGGPLAVLRSLSQDEDAIALLGELARDPLFQKIDRLCRGGDGFRAREKFNFLKYELSTREGFSQSAGMLLNYLEDNAAEDAPFKAEIEDFKRESRLGFSFSRFDKALPQLVDGLTNSSTLVAMAGAPFLAATLEPLYFLPASLARSRILFSAGKAFALGGRVAADAGAFVALRRGVESLRFDPGDLWNPQEMFREWHTSLPLFGAFHLSQHFSARFGNLLAEGRLGAWARNANAEKTLSIAATGHLVFAKPIAQLSRAGSLMEDLINHGLGIAAVYGANRFNLHFQGARENEKIPGVFEAGIFYLQGLFGYRMMNHLSGGALMDARSDVMLRIERNIRGTKPTAPAIPETPPPEVKPVDPNEPVQARDAELPPEPPRDPLVSPEAEVVLGALKHRVPKPPVEPVKVEHRRIFQNVFDVRIQNGAGTETVIPIENARLILEGQPATPEQIYQLKPGAQIQLEKNDRVLIFDGLDAGTIRLSEPKPSQEPPKVPAPPQTPAAAKREIQFETGKQKKLKIKEIEAIAISGNGEDWVLEIFTDKLAIEVANQLSTSGQHYLLKSGTIIKLANKYFTFVVVDAQNAVLRETENIQAIQPKARDESLLDTVVAPEREPPPEALPSQRNPMFPADENLKDTVAAPERPRARVKKRPRPESRNFEEDLRATTAAPEAPSAPAKPKPAANEPEREDLRATVVAGHLKSTAVKKGQAEIPEAARRSRPQSAFQKQPPPPDPAKMPPSYDKDELFFGKSNEIQLRPSSSPPSLSEAGRETSNYVLKVPSSESGIVDWFRSSTVGRIYRSGSLCILENTSRKVIIEVVSRRGTVEQVPPKKTLLLEDGVTVRTSDFSFVFRKYPRGAAN